MGSHSGPYIVNDGLVFAYDMDNAAKSFKGKPTTNIITITDLDTGWSQGYNTSIQWNDYIPPQGVNSQVVSFIDADGNGSGYWYSYGDYAPQQPSTTYTISVYARTIGSDWSIRAYTADNSEVGRQYTNILTVPGDGKWHRLEFDSITTPSNTESDSLSFLFSNIPAGQRCWLCAPQMEEGSFATPFVNGTRSNTQALLDMSKSKNTITATSLTYNSDGTFRLNSSNPDYLDLGSDKIIKTSGGWTVETWIKYDAVPGGYDNINSPGNFIGSDSVSYNSWYWSVFNGKLALWNISPGTWKYGSTTLQANTWYNAVLVSDPSGTSYQMYLNGVAEGGNHTTYSWNPSYSGLRVRYIGIANASNIRRLNGMVPVTKIYDKALTAAEIKQNFNATRGRFGI